MFSHGRVNVNATLMFPPRSGIFSKNHSPWVPCQPTVIVPMASDSPAVIVLSVIRRMAICASLGTVTGNDGKLPKESMTTNGPVASAASRSAGLWSRRSVMKPIAMRAFPAATPSCRIASGVGTRADDAERGQPRSPKSWVCSWRQ